MDPGAVGRPSSPYDPAKPALAKPAPVSCADADDEMEDLFGPEPEDIAG